MQVTIEVGSDALSVEFTKLMESISEEQRMAMIERVMMGWLFQTQDAELAAFIARQEAAQKGHWVNEYEARDRVKKYQSPREQLLTAIATGAIAGAAKRVERLLAEDHSLDSLWEKSRDFIVSKFPQMVQNAMVRWFSDRFANMQGHIEGTYSESNLSKNLSTELASHLGLEQ